METKDIMMAIVMIIAGIAAIVVVIASIYIPLKILSLILNNAKKQKKQIRCNYCENSYILCKHDDTWEDLTRACYCPMCGKRL